MNEDKLSPFFGVPEMANSIWIVGKAAKLCVLQLTMNR